MAKEHLLLVDGLNMIRRIYGANPAPDTPEKAKGAIKATRGSFARALQSHSPSHCLWAFDHGGHTWRHALYAAYKANRKPMPEPLRDEIESFKSELADKGWTVAAYPGFEAEDTMASVGALARGAGMAVTALSNDKDILTLLDLGIVVYDHFSYQALDDAHCIKKFGVPASQVIEVLALFGDAVDGVPGVDSVGEKTAAKLIKEHGTVEGVLAASAGIKGAVGARLREQADMAKLSRQLVSLRFDVLTVSGHAFDLEELVVGRPL